MVVARTSHHQGLVSRTSVRGHSSSATGTEGATTTLLPTRTWYFTYFAFCIFCIFCIFAPCPQVQLPHDRLLVLDGHHRPGPDVQEADPTDSQGGRPEVENLKMCGLHAPASRDNVGAWCSHAKILQQASRLEKGTLYTQVGSWTFTKLYPPKSLFHKYCDVCIFIVHHFLRKHITLLLIIRHFVSDGKI